MTRQIKVTPSSGNVFKDLGLPNPEELLAKAELVRRISAIVDRRRLTQTATAKLLGTTQPKISDLLRGRLDGFAMERLIRYLNALDQDVEIVVRPKPRGRRKAQVTVIAA
jgi:predicted XRE-type DNA-binding protein